MPLPLLSNLFAIKCIYAERYASLEDFRNDLSFRTSFWLFQRVKLEVINWKIHTVGPGRPGGPSIPGLPWSPLSPLSPFEPGVPCIQTFSTYCFVTNNYPKYITVYNHHKEFILQVKIRIWILIFQLSTYYSWSRRIIWLRFIAHARSYDLLRAIILSHVFFSILKQNLSYILLLCEPLKSNIHKFQVFYNLHFCR